MAARPLPSSPAPRHHPVPDRHTVLEGCRRYASGAPADPGTLLDSLTYLKSCLDAWAAARLGIAGCAAPAAAPSLGEFARFFATWLAAHPRRANEPLDWLVREALLAADGRRTLV